MNLLPYPRSLKRLAGIFVLPKKQPLSAITFLHSTKAPDHPEGYALTIDRKGVRVEYREVGGLRSAGATLRQLLREYGRRLPCLKIRDWPDFARRGVMLDISRGRVPKLETLLDLVERLADFKINEFQLYTEHTFAYRGYKSVWRDWGALTAEEIRTLDARCRELGIDLVPNQNSFGHLRYFLEHPKLKQLAEVSEPYEGSTGDFLRFPTTLAPNNPGTIKFIRELYDELLPNFSSRFFNVGCDETWDLGRGQSKTLCEKRGKGRVYVDFLRQIQGEVAKRGRRMMFWGDIILHHPELLKGLPKDVIALNWGYEANHPFAKETATFAKFKVPFYVCPGTATWMTLIGRHDTAFANLRLAAEAGRKHGALGYLNTDWGDGGHPQPLAVSWPLYAIGAAHSWCSKSFDQKLLVPVLSRDVYADPSHRIAKAAIALGFAHRKFDYLESNITPCGAVIAAPPPETRELFCRSGLKYYARIKPRNVRAALAEVENQRFALGRAKPTTRAGAVLKRELDLAARMAAASCRIMLWQQALAAGKAKHAARLAKLGIRELQSIERDFKRYWPTRNKGTTARCSAFLQWRIGDYRSGKLHFRPEAARLAKPRTYAAE
ncbi:MAG TPA: family 20 glycosylhydrolase [Verrucomicrobiae bacterium]|nr:family 20 glycosylhydrolase [Verrucomicrobiae bacterium]